MTWKEMVKYADNLTDDNWNIKRGFVLYPNQLDKLRKIYNILVKG